MQKAINNIWFLICSAILVAALGLGAVITSCGLMTKSSTLAFFIGAFMLIMTIIMYVFWTYLIFDQIGVLLREKNLKNKSEKTKKDE